jgi:4Fe-4S ferredoxin
MPLKTVKKDTAEAQTLEWILQVQDYKLTLDKNRCVGCQICSLACPKEAIKVQKQPKIQGQKAKKAKVDVDLAKCNFCGICDITCPYGAIRVTMNGEHLLSVVEKKSFPQLVRDIKVNAENYAPGFVGTSRTCPIDLIKLAFIAPEGKPIEKTCVSVPAEVGVRAKIDVDKEHCPCCRVCEFTMPPGVMHVRKFISGRISIHPERCPEGCTDCLDVCPITGALYLSDDRRKVNANETFCVYCGACKAVCPVDEALDISRTAVNHTPVHSGTWNKALERLTSPTEMTKELKTKSSLRARESVKRRVGRAVE